MVRGRAQGHSALCASGWQDARIPKLHSLSSVGAGFSLPYTRLSEKSGSAGIGGAFPGKSLIFHSQSRSDGREPGAARRRYSYPIPAIP